MKQFRLQYFFTFLIVTFLMYSCNTEKPQVKTENSELTVIKTLYLHGMKEKQKALL